MKILLAVAMAVTPAHSTTPTLAEIDHATAVIASRVTVPGTAFGWDPASKRIVVTVDRTVTGAALDAVEGAVREAGRTAHLQRSSATLQTFIAGGQAVYSGHSRCSLGANARSGSTYFFITAGHCTTGTRVWYADRANTIVLGTVAGSSFPADDYGVVRYTNTNISHPSAVYTYPRLLAINGWGNGYVGQHVCRSGSTTGVHCGVITALNATVNFPGGAIFGLIRTNICAEPGDSGGPLYDPANGRILGILVGGSGNCATGGVTYYQPIGEILARYGLTIP